MNPGKNLTVITEVIAMNQLLVYAGVNVPARFDDGVRRAMNPRDSLLRTMSSADKRARRARKGDHSGARRDGRRLGRRRSADCRRCSGCAFGRAQPRDEQRGSLPPVRGRCWPGGGMSFSPIWQAGGVNLAAMAVTRERPESTVVTAVNLPMLLDFVFHRRMALDALVPRLVERGRQAIGPESGSDGPGLVSHRRRGARRHR